MVKGEKELPFSVLRCSKDALAENTHGNDSDHNEHNHEG